MDANAKEGGEDAGASSAPRKTRTPPYVAYKTFLTLLKEFKDNGVPPQVDRSVLKRFAGGLQGQLMLALRSLDLMDGNNRPQPSLQVLVDAYETDGFKAAMTAMVRQTYPYVFALDLSTATPTMFADAFKNALDAKEEVLRKCRTFFLHAAKDLDIPLGPRIATAQFVRAARTNGGKRPKAPKTAPEVAPGTSQENLGQNGRENERDVLARLLDKFPDFDPNWDEQLKAKWFAGFDQFMKAAKK